MLAVVHNQEATFMFSKIRSMMQSLNEAEEYIPKQSKRISPKNGPTSDNDTWVEHIAVMKDTNIKRSYFKSKNTNKCVWDEPPSGACKIILFEDRC